MAYRQLKLISSIILTAAVIFSCQPQANNLKPIDYRETPIPTDTAYCSVAEKHLNDLCEQNRTANNFCCVVGSHTAKEKSFTEFCRETQEAGIALNPRCLSSILTCDQIDKCVGTTR